jgi:hypothetical protein
MSSSPETPEVRRLALLREFKLRMLRPGGANLSPFADRVVTADDDIARTDLPTLHGEVRDHIAHQIAAVHARGRSQVVLLSGEAGAGKSHILRHFARPKEANEHGYMFVGGSNDWRVDEFQPCLLDWMIRALTEPSPSTDHPLLERVRAIGFRAVGQLLENRTSLKRCLAKRRRGLLGRLFSRSAGYDSIAALVRDRDPGVFGLLDFARFSDDVCNRFLAEPGSPVHRYALRVLLTYLFPDQEETGVGTRERVLNWFRRKPDDGYWAKRLGVADDLTRRYAVADAIKLLVHLFSPDLSRRLSTEGEECRPVVFLFAFDQAEGREELFDTPADWDRFFAHLSELYNTLPNVLVLFTMTLHLRNQLHPKMELQFRDRIRKDERYVLRQPAPHQIRELYCGRLGAWLADRQDLSARFDALPEPERCLPFGIERVGQIGGTQSVRATLEAFDGAFHEEMLRLVIDPEYDFEFVRGEQQPVLEDHGEYDYTVDHLDTVWELVEPLADDLAAEHGGVRLMSIVEEEVDSLRVLKLTFADPSVTSSWVCVYLARFGKHYNPSIEKCSELLKGKQYLRYSAWMVRPREMNAELPKPDQMFARLIEPGTEARLWAALHLFGKRSEYEARNTWASAWEIICREIRGCYLGEMFAHARDRVNAKKAGGVPDESVTP